MEPVFVALAVFLLALWLALRPTRQRCYADLEQLINEKAFAVQLQSPGASPRLPQPRRSKSSIAN